MLNAMYSIFDRLTEQNEVYKVCNIHYCFRKREIPPKKIELIDLPR